MWKIIEHFYGDATEVTGFKTKREAVSYAQCTRCTEAAPKKIARGVYELLGRDRIVQEA